MENQTNSSNIEQEVYRITPKIGKYYFTSFYTSKSGSYLNNNEKYYTTNPLLYVGKHIESCQTSFGDGAESLEVFEKDDGTRENIHYDYEGRRVFKEMTPDIPPQPQPQPFLPINEK